MNNLRIVALSLLCLTIHILPSTDAFNATAQGQSASLEGTRYEGLVTVLPPSVAGLRLLHTFYIFEKQGKVICRRTIVGAGHDQMEFKYNPVTRRNENVRVNVPSEYSSIDEIGRYQQTRTGVRLEFSDRYIEAAPKVERSVRGLDGITTFRESDKREQFVVVLREDHVSGLSNESSNNAASSGDEGGVSLPDVTEPEDANDSISDGLLLGSWRYVEYNEGYQIGNIKTPPSIKQEMIVTYNRNGTQDAVFKNSVSVTTAKGDWRYAPQTPKSGIVELYRRGELVWRGSVQWRDRNTIEQVTLFSNDPSFIGQRIILRRVVR